MVAHLMRQPLLISGLLTHAERHHGTREIVTRLAEGSVHRCSYRDLAARARRLANALARHGVRAAERVASLAWNSHRHLELCHAVAGSGAVLHTLAPDTGPEQVAWMLRHAEDRMLFFDLGFLPVVEAALPLGLPVEHLVVMTDRAHMPAARPGLPLLCYEDLLSAQRAVRPGPSSTRTRPLRCATCMAMTACRAACCTATARRCCRRAAALQPDAFGCSSSDVVLLGGADVARQRLGPAARGLHGGRQARLRGPVARGRVAVPADRGRTRVGRGRAAARLAVGAHAPRRTRPGLGRWRRMIVGGLPPGGRLLHAWGPTGTGVAGTVCVLGPGQLDPRARPPAGDPPAAGAGDVRRRDEDHRRRGR